MSEPSALERHVTMLMRLMASSRWTPRLIPILSKRWKVSESAVRRATAEASRRVRAGIELDVDLHDLLTMQVHTGMADAERIRKIVMNPRSKAHSYRLALDAIRVKTEAARVLLGVRRDKAPPDEDLSRKTDDELRTIIDQLDKERGQKNEA
jgi:hypothetical protein